MTKPRLAIALLSVLLVSGCAARSVHIAQLKDQPYRYYNKTVSVSGTVTNSWGLPLVPFQLYSVDDGTGQITVLSNRGLAPRKGTRVPGRRLRTGVAMKSAGRCAARVGASKLVGFTRAEPSASET